MLTHVHNLEGDRWSVPLGITGRAPALLAPKTSVASSERWSLSLLTRKDLLKLTTQNCPLSPMRVFNSGNFEHIQDFIGLMCALVS